MNQTEITYEQIRGLVTELHIDRSRLTCVFVCPVSGARVTGQADVVKANGDATTTKVKSRLRQSFAKSLTRTVTRSVRSVLGSNEVSRLVGELSGDAAKQAANRGTFDENEIERATIVAFEQKAARQFVWDAEREGFVHKDAAKAVD